MKYHWTAITIFALFFGVSLLEAVQTKNWVLSGFWLLIGIVFLVGDIVNTKRQ